MDENNRIIFSADYVNSFFMRICFKLTIDELADTLYRTRIGNVYDDINNHAQFKFLHSRGYDYSRFKVSVKHSKKKRVIPN